MTLRYVPRTQQRDKATIRYKRRAPQPVQNRHNLHRKRRIDAIPKSVTGGFTKEDEYKILANVCMLSFEDFVRNFWDTIIPEKLKWNWHMKVLCDQLQEIALRVARGEKKLHDLIINISPGTSKSTICSIMFPAWVWTFMPHARFICTSYSERLAYDLSVKCRDVIKSDLYKLCYPDVKIKSDQDTKGYFANKKGGQRYSNGSGGSVTGHHGHFIICDDPLDPEESSSDHEIANTNRWMKDTLFSRKIDKSVSVTILVMQRLHQDDPTQMMLDSAGRVRHIKIPATTEFEIFPEELKQFYTKGMMDPDRLPMDYLLEVKHGERGDYVYSGQYGQEPVPQTGALFKIDRLHADALPPTRFQRVVRYWDKAATEGGGAYTVGLKMALDFDERIWILDVIRVRFDSAKREHLILKTARADGRNVLVGLEQEPGSGGKESAERTAKALALIGHRCKYNPAKGDKVVRADPFSVVVNTGNVYLFPGKPWIPAFKSELRYFPFSKYKDHVDAASGAFTLIWTGRKVVGGLMGSRPKDVELNQKRSREMLDQYVKASLAATRSQLQEGSTSMGR